MPLPSLKATRSAASSRAAPDVKPDVDASNATFTSLRRSTRSTAQPETKLDLSMYAYSPPKKRVKREVVVKAQEDELLVAIEDLKPDIKPSRAASAAASGSSTPKRGQPMPKRAKAHPEPAKWRQQYALIERMRAGIDAPVDTMGCERPRTADGLDAKTLRFHVLISLMLSSQTKDAVTSQAVLNLHNAIEGGLTAETLAVAPAEVVSEAINKVGFWRRKSEYIQLAARKLLEQPGEMRGDVPKTIEALCDLKGVGPKMGMLALQVAWDINAGIGVDVHVHRITNRLKWHKPPTKTPEETRVNLESWLPHELYKPINPLLVGFGQVICLPVGPRCDVCLLGQQKLCPSRVAVNAANRKEVAFTFTADAEGSGGAKVEIGYEEELKLKDEVKEERMEEVIQVKAEEVTTVVKEEPL